MSAPGVHALRLDSGGYALDAVEHVPTGTASGAMVVCHPHPGHGGNMDHPVVVLLAERAAAAGLAALRFDFRGVRRSEGDVDDADGHLDDVCRAAAWLRARVPDGPLLGGGFSYGARQLARAVQPEGERCAPSDVRGASLELPGASLVGLLLLAPATKVPRTARDFGNLLLGRPLDEAARDAPAVRALGRIPVRTRVLVGDHDVVAPVDDLAEALAPTAALTVLEGLNHFFSRQRGAGPTAYDVLTPAIDRALAALTGGSTAAPASPRAGNASARSGDTGSGTGTRRSGGTP